MRLLAIAVLFVQLFAVVAYIPKTEESRPAPLTYSTLRYRMLDGSFRRPYRVLSDGELLGKLRLASTAIAREEARRLPLPYYSGMGKGR
ncbi:hypothetical protein PRIPAC_80963 [Pristionchus pacificus]|uniref:Uncharacterized protein n=1 Tax=Pristionchus pacificus TaxID=54126 RepID=A0A454Y5P0_PRIPA|nr:hypothetical protein PRIPAC_80963 [Pristionchus pacificus]|eukprot:PDM78524.1 hypothetical protein PRIPAC_31103 [Pristionchus pacificus]